MINIIGYGIASHAYMEKRLALFITIVLSISKTTFSKTPPLKFSSPAPISIDQPVTITADIMSFNHLTNEYLAQGNVEIVQGDQKLKADRVKYNLETQEADASGNVFLIQGEDTLASDSIKLNLKTQMGTVKNAKIYMKEMNYQITGKEIERTGADSYHVIDGIITTCNGDRPDWRITGKDIKVKLNGNAVIRDATFQIKNVPFIYLPVVVYPIITERQSGFLMPEFDFSSTRGFESNIAYYWALSPQTDSTFYLDLASKKGIGEGFEFRYLLNPENKGKFYLYHTRETNDYFHHKYENPLDRDKERLYVNYEGEFYFSKTFYTKALYYYVSDREIYHDYSEEIKRTDYLSGRTSFRSREKDESLLFLTKNWDNYSLIASLDYYTNLLGSNKKTLERLPQITFSGRKQKIGESPFYFSFESSYNYLWREEGIKGGQFDFHPVISLPLNLRNYIKIDPSIGLRQLTYIDLNQNGFDKNRFLFDVHTKLSTNIYKIFTFPGREIEKIRHSLEPEIVYSYVPEQDQEELPSFEPLSNFDKKNTLSYSLTNRLTAKILNQNGSSTERELGFLKIGQRYNLSKAECKSIPDEEKKEGFGNLYSELRLDIHPLIYYKSQFGYNPHHRSLSFYNILINFQNTKGDYLNVGYRYVRDLIEGIHLRSKIKLSPTWEGFYELRRNDFYHTNLDSIYGVGYNAPCWSMKFYFHEKPAQVGRKRENKFALVLSLTGLGEIAGLTGSID